MINLTEGNISIFLFPFPEPELLDGRTFVWMTTIERALCIFLRWTCFSVEFWRETLGRLGRRCCLDVTAEWEDERRRWSFWSVMIFESKNRTNEYAAQYNILITFCFYMKGILKGFFSNNVEEIGFDVLCFSKTYKKGVFRALIINSSRFFDPI